VSNPSNAHRLKYIIGIFFGIPAAFYSILNIWTFFRPDPGCSLLRPRRERILHSVPLNLQQSQHLGDVWTNATGSDARLKLVSINWGGPYKRAYEVRIAGDVVHESRDGGPFVPNDDILIERTRTLSITRDRNYPPDERKALASEVTVEVCKK